MTTTLPLHNADDLIEYRQIRTGSKTSLSLFVTVLPSSDVAVLDEEYSVDEVRSYEASEWGLVDIWVTAHHYTSPMELGAAVMRKVPYGEFPGEQEERNLDWYLRHDGPDFDYLLLEAQEDARRMIRDMSVAAGMD